MAEICNWDCFNCVHPDCIQNDMPVKAWEESKALDARLIPKTERQLYRARHSANYYAANRERCLQYQKEYRKNNLEAVKAAQARWYQEHREECKAKHRAYRAKKRKEALNA